MKLLKTFGQLLEWTLYFLLIPPNGRTELIQPYQHHQVTPRATLPVLARDLKLVITSCVGFVTSCVLCFVALGWGEALFAIPIFIISLFAALLYPGLRERYRTRRPAPRKKRRKRP